MEINSRKVGKCKVLECSGPLILGPATAAVRRAIREAAEDGTKRIILDLGNVPYMDSAGIGELIAGFVHVRNKDGNLSLLNLTKKISKLLVVAKLLTIFDVFEDEQEAVKGCE